jgi:hypothetical protein
MTVSADQAPRSLPVPANDLPAETEPPSVGLFLDKIICKLLDLIRGKVCFMQVAYMD